MATYDELMSAARKADAAGDGTAAKRFLELAQQAQQSNSTVTGSQAPARVGEEQGESGPWWQSPYFEAALMGAGAIPATALLARGLQLGLRGTRMAQGASAISRAVTPTTGAGLAVEGVGGAAAGVAGYTAGQQFPEGWQRTTAEFGAGALTGVPFSVVGSLFGLKQAGPTTLKEMANQGSSWLSNAKTSSAAKTAIEANPTLVPDVQRAKEIEAVLGTDLPPLARANGDTTISAFLAQQMAKGENSPFIARIKNIYEDAEAAIRAQRDGMAPTMEEVQSFVRQQAKMTERQNEVGRRSFEAEQATRSATTERLTNELRAEAAKIEGKPDEATATRMRNLIAARETAIGEKFSKEYEDFLTTAEQNGVKMPGTLVAEVRKFALDEKSLAVFHKFPDLYDKVISVFRPKSMVGSDSKLNQKYRFDKSGEKLVTEAASVRDIDSLKREINAQLRKISGKPDQTDNVRYLTRLRDQLDGALNQMDPQFRAGYRDIDERYYTELGIPFKRANGVIKINRARFIEDTVPMLTSRAQTLREAITAMGGGAEATEIASDAIMYKLSTNRGIINTKSGEINPEALTRYIKENAEIIDQIPGMRKKLEGLAGNTEQLRNTRTRIMEEQKTAQYKEVENLWTQSYNTNDGIKSIVRQALTNQSKLDGLLNITRQSPNAANAVKGAVLEDLISMSGNRLEIFNQNREALKKLFGPNLKEIEAMVEASQRLKDNPFNAKIQPETAKKTDAERITGNKPENVASDLRNPIMSNFRKVAGIMSRYWQNQATKQEAAEMQKLLLNLDTLPQVASFMQEVSINGASQKALGLFNKLASSTGVRYLLYGGSGTLGGTANDNPDAAINKPTNPALLEGFKR